ncbi:uncharacterized protein [Ptychodera flava]|uniref:uncharacterized protein n=1 Tax=Ptychodera flava TaxID=63121 RepID=UPI00396A0F96
MTEIVNDHAIPGLFGIHTCNLKLGKQVRKVDDYFVQTLVDSMEKCTDESYSPYVVMVDVKKDDFNKNNVNGYKYTILGGQHNYTATKQLAEKYKDRQLFKSRQCKIYCSLNEEQSMWLANRHNDMQHLVHKLSTKKSLMDCNSSMNDTDMDTILHLAKQTETVAVKLDEIFENYGRGVLAGQRVTKKNLMAKPDIPVYLF